MVRKKAVYPIVLLLVLSIVLCACGSNGKVDQATPAATTEASADSLADEEITKLLTSDIWYSVPTNKANGYQFVGGGVGYLKIVGAKSDFSFEWKISDGYVIMSLESMGQTTRNSLSLKKVDGIYRLQSELDTEGAAYMVREQDFDAAVAAAGLEFTEPEETEITQTTHCTLDGVYIDNSYENKDNSSLKLVYVCYTAHTDDQNLKLSSKLSNLTFDSGNTYSSSHYPKSCTDYMPNYHSSDYIEDVYIGQSLKVVSVFEVPVGEFNTGDFFTVAPYGLPDGEVLKIRPETVQYFDTSKELAETADPTGYEETLQNHEAADQQTTAKVKAAINGYKWSFYVNSISYEIEFFSPNRFELRVRALNVKNGGTYTVQKGYVVCTYDSNGAVVEIPYSFGPDDIDLRVTDAFDVRS